MIKRRFLRLFFAIAIIFTFSATTARATVLSFDDITTSSFDWITSYGGFNWDSMVALDPAALYPSTTNGYHNSVVSPDYVASFTLASPLATVTAVSGPFDFNGAYFTGAWRDGLNIDVVGYRGSTAIYSDSVVVNSTSPLWLQFDYKAIDYLEFTSYGGVSGGYGGLAENFIMDDFTFNEPIANPEPSTFILLGAGLVGVAYWRRRKKLKG